ncbi:post-transcriptional regulator [Alicyclobacillus fastidiosus]|uniref:Post-transcriptional regulator n=1 Tax=Alicyclobacillus fastidiosus TaxID=392011 RepID=A0ABV5AD25_9BACL|nr:post-transcriptional regulator [Alicyclobacillus fastidiosus]WEH11211.1 post-transcriptional regulator [Alicyclobacillus fastidiosus]
MNPVEETQIRPYMKELLSLCATKVEEFRLLGYEEAKLEQVWSFVCAKLPADTPIHRMVDFILSIRVMDFMNYQTIEAYKGEL